MLHTWRAHKASILGNAAPDERRRGIDAMDSRPNDFRLALVAKARQYLSAHLNEKVGLAEIATAVDVPPAYLAETFKIVERFTRTAPSKIDCKVTVDDPTTGSRPWAFAIPRTRTDQEAICE